MTTPRTFEEAVYAASQLLKEPLRKPSDPELDPKIVLSLLEQDFFPLEEWFRGERDDDLLVGDFRIFANTAVWALASLTNLRLQDARRTVVAKQRDYGHGNILRFGLKGIIIRLSDKLARLRNLIERGRNAANESITDTYLDIVGYSLIALMLLNDTFALPLQEDAPKSYAPDKPVPDVAGRDVLPAMQMAVNPDELIVGHLPVAGWGT